MKKFLLLFAFPALLIGAFLLLSGNRVSPAMNSQAVEEMTFVGSEACKTCHSDKYDSWIMTGHPYKFTVVEGGVEPVYPAEAVNFQSQWMDSLGDGTHTWNDIAGVIGGYGWKTRFVGTDGHIVGSGGSSFSGGVGHNQINFFGGEFHGWVDYEVSKMEKLYNYSCFKCHTTGGDTSGTWLDGVEGLGTFTEGGIGCESCHGPGSEHVAGPTKDNIDRVYEFAHLDNSLGGLEVDGVVQTPDPEGDDINFLCGTCHNRSYTDPINSSGGFIKHHEQWDELMATKHGDMGLTCKSCHNPHKRTIWDGDGVTANCTQCHSEEAALVHHSGSANCVDCHMPFASKSGTKRGKSGYKGDVRSHLVKIATDTASMFTEDGSAVKDDEERGAALSPGFACLGCHNDDPEDGISDKTLVDAAAGAMGMHVANSINTVETGLSLSIYPNPSTGPTQISFHLSVSDMVDLRIFSTAGQTVYVMSKKLYPAGTSVIEWNGRSNAGNKVKPGYYYVRVSSGSTTSVDKMIMLD